MVARAPRRFRDRDEMPTRGGLLASRIAALRQPAASRGQGVLAGRVGAMREHPAVGFGRSMAGLGTAAGPISRITGDVFARLAERGIYRDSRGTWQIAGMERSDPSIAIRDSAIAAMDPSGKWAGLVASTEPDLSTPRPALASRVAEIAAPATVTTTRTETPPNVVTTGRTTPSGSVTAPPISPSSTPAQRSALNRSAGSAGLLPPGGQGVAPPSDAPVTPTTSDGNYNPPNRFPPGGQGVGRNYPAKEPYDPRAGMSPFPPQGQGVGRTTTPTGAEVDPATYPRTDLPTIAAPIRLDERGNPVSPGGGRVGQQAAPSGPMGTAGVPRNPNAATPAAQPLIGVMRGLEAKPLTDQMRTLEATATMRELEGAAQGYLSPEAAAAMKSRPPDRPPTGPWDPNQAQISAGESVTPGLAAGPSTRGMRPSGPAPTPIRTTPGQAATPATPGPATTPTVAPGAVPGNTTPSRPGQLPPSFGTGTPSYGTGDLSTLGERIRASVGQQVGQVGASPGGVSGLSGLGERIRASVARATGDIGVSAPGGGRPGLGNLGQSIMESVRGQLAANQVNAQLGPAPTGVTPGLAAPVAPAGPQTAVSPMTGGAPQSQSNTLAAPAPGPAGSLGAPQGQIPMGAITGGGDWATINQYDPLLSSAAAKHGVDPAMLKAMLVIESGGNPDAMGIGGAIGLMQVKPEYWGAEAASMGYDLNTPEGQIGMAAAILGGDVAATRGMTPEEAFLTTYYPVYDANGNLCMDCRGESGHTPGMYLSDMEMYMGIINGAAPTTAGPGTGGQAIPSGGNPAWNPDGTLSDAGLASLGVAPEPATSTVEGEMFPGSTRPIDHSKGIPMVRDANGNLVPAEATGAAGPNVISPPTTGPASVGSGDIVYDSSGGMLSAADITYGLGAPECDTCGGMYIYGADHGLNGRQHTGIDVGIPYGETFYSPISGVVTCQGTDDGPGSWETGCAMFGNSNGGGTGRVEVMADNGVSYIFGHTLEGHVTTGQRISPGDPLGTSGWDPDAAHYHLEARVWCENIGTYWIVDPQVAMTVADGSQLCPR